MTVCVGVCLQEDFYVVRNGRLSDLDEPLLHGAVYHLEPRLCGGKGGMFQETEKNKKVCEETEMKS